MATIFKNHWFRKLTLLGLCWFVFFFKLTSNRYWRDCMKKLYRLECCKMIAGVCAGIADLYKIDVTIVRLATVFLTVFTMFWPGIITYIVAWFLMPEKKELFKTDETPQNNVI
jgi:phage shock protein C